ncbi:MAG TPA: lactonase family protein [Terracidiphilus sp.]|nr:lactonase family protein [Terracidiphilus sp.]
MPRSLHAALEPLPRQRVFVASHTPDGIVAFDWDPTAAALMRVGVAAKVPNVAWLAMSGDTIFSASELDTFEGQPTGEVASFRLAEGELKQLSARNSAGTGTCHVAVDATGRMLVAADYTGASAASFRIEVGRLSEAVWTEHYTEQGPNPDRQKTAHAHFASFSPDNRFAYINDLGDDCIHIYKPDVATAQMTAAGTYRGAPGSGARTLRFHPNGHTAYCMNEIASTVDVLEWHKADGNLTLLDRIDLLPADYHGPTRGCDTVITRDGRFVYFANRDDNFLYSFKADAKTGRLTAMKRSNCGGKTPRHFTLDPTERWMLVANQDSNSVCVFARDAATGLLADEVHSSVDVEAPMRILFV